MFRKLVFIVIGLFCILQSNAQNDITIGLVMPEEELNGVRPDAYSLLKSKLEKMLTSTGVSSYGGDFVMYPTVDVVEENIIEGGIKNFFKVKIELTLKVVNYTSKTLFASESWTLSGTSERMRSPAVKNAFTQLKGTDPHFKAFIENTKGKILEYYEQNKNAILTNASTLASTGEYEPAIALLASYPSQVSGYNEAQSLMCKIHAQYVNANAMRILNEARAAYATKDYEQAVNLAAQIDPTSSHYNEAKSIIDQVRSTINKEQAAANQRAMKALEIAADVEKNRVNAAASVARAYYNRRVINYNVIRIY